jgi:hypothetical protein
MPSISMPFSLTEMILHRVIAIRFGRTGECVAKTPRIGLFLSPRGWTWRIERFAGVSLRLPGGAEG